MEYLFYYMAPTPNKIQKIKANKTHKILVKIKESIELK